MRSTRTIRLAAVFVATILLGAACADSPTGVVGEAPVGTMELSDSVFTQGLILRGRPVIPAGYRLRPGSARWSVVSGSASIEAIDGSSDSVTITLTGSGAAQFRVAYALTADGVGSVLGIAGPTRRTDGDVQVEAVRTLAVATPILTYVTEPTRSATAGVSLGAVRLEVRDARGRVMTGATDSLTVALDPASGTAGATLLGAVRKRAVAGVATFPDLVIQRAGLDYRLIASSRTIAAADTALTSIVAAAPSAAQSTIVVADSGRTVGQTTTVTVTVRDAFGNPVLTATPATLGKSVTAGTLGAFACVNGVCTATFESPTTPATASIAATIGGAAIGGSPRSVDVRAGAATKFVIFGDSVQLAGTEQLVTVVAQDAFGNPAASYTGPKVVTFSGAAAAPVGTIPTAAAIELTKAVSLRFEAGRVTAPMTLFRAEIARITVTDGTLTTTGDDRLLVRVRHNVPDAAQTTYQVLETTETVGGKLVVRVTVKDAYGNVVTSATKEDFGVTPSAGALGEFSCTEGVCDAEYTAPETPGAPTFTAKVGTTDVPGTPPSVTITPGAPDPATSTLAVAATELTVGGTTTVTVTLRDKFSNLVTTAGPTAFVASASIPTLGPFTCVNAVCTATYTGNTVGLASIAATIGGTGMVGSTKDVQVRAGAAARLVITGTSAQVAGVPQTITITARDAAGNVATGYDGAKTLTFSGGTVAPNGTNPDVSATPFGTGTSVTFASGVATAPLSLFAVATDSIGTTDGAIAAAGADRLIVAVTASAADANASEITATPSTLVANGTAKATLATQLKDAFGNSTDSVVAPGTVAIVKVAGDGTLLGTVRKESSGRYVDTVQAPPAAPAVTGEFSLVLNGVTGSKKASITYVAAGGPLSRIVCTTSQPAGQNAASSTTVNLCAAAAAGDLEIVTLALDGVDDITAPPANATNGTWVKIATKLQSTGTGGNKAMLLVLYARRYQAGNARTVTFTGATQHKWSVDMITFLSTGSALPASSAVTAAQSSTGANLTVPGFGASLANTVLYYVVGNSLTGNTVATPAGVTALANNNTGGTSSTSFMEIAAVGPAQSRTFNSTKSANTVVVQLLVLP